MSKTVLRAAPLLLFVLAGVAQAKVYVDYDPDARFGEYKTYAFAPNEDNTLEKQNPLMHDRIIGMIKEKLDQYGLQEVEQNPDVWVVYNVALEEQVQLHTTGMGYDYGYGAGWRRYGGWGMGMGTTTTRATTYTYGTLIIDAWDSQTETLVWRGQATSQMSDNPETTTKRIQKSLDKLVKQWIKIREKELGLPKP